MLVDTSYLASCLTLGFVLLPWSARAVETNWLDVESRIQYGYYTEDPRALAGVVVLIAPEFAEARRLMAKITAG